MAQRVILHLSDEDPIVAELERLPEPGDNYIRVVDPRHEDGKTVHYLKEGSSAVLFPLHRITSIELLAEGAAREEQITFFREEPG
jgi:hypothetical protein